MGDNFPLGETKVYIMGKELDLPVVGSLRFEPRSVTESFDDVRVGSLILTATIRTCSRMLRKFIVREFGRKPKTTYRTIRRQCAKRNKRR